MPTARPTFSRSSNRMGLVQILSDQTGCDIKNTFGKFIDRLAQLSGHIRKSPNYGSLQSAYRVFRSTETAMTRVVNNLLVSVDSGSASLLLSLDVSAAFDTLNRERLLQRAEDLFGFTSNTNLWLASYLADRIAALSQWELVNLILLFIQLGSLN